MNDTRAQYQALGTLYLVIAIAVAAIISGLVILAALRFRAGRRERPPSRRHDAPVLEAAYAFGLTAIAAFLLFHTYRTENRIDTSAATPAVRVDVTAAKWNWRFAYPAYGITESGSDTRPSTLVVPAHRRVRFSLTSIDVIHAFWLPHERFKRDANPGRTSHFELLFDDAGAFDGLCSEFCGLRHQNMRFAVEVLSPANFARWVSDHRSGR